MCEHCIRISFSRIKQAFLELTWVSHRLVKWEEKTNCGSWLVSPQEKGGINCCSFLSMIRPNSPKDPNYYRFPVSQGERDGQRGPGPAGGHGLFFWGGGVPGGRVSSDLLEQRPGSLFSSARSQLLPSAGMVEAPKYFSPETRLWVAMEGTSTYSKGFLHAN